MHQCPSAKDWLYRQRTDKLEYIEAYFSAHGYSPHRHDTYAVGRTLSGVQSFNYRGALRHGLTKNTIVLHPDELHDGQAGTNEGFRYRMIYIEPVLVQQILGGAPLPFIAEGVSTDPRLYRAAGILLQRPDIRLDLLEEEDALYDLITALCRTCRRESKSNFFDYLAANRAREFIDDSLERNICLDELARQAGRDRWSLSRDFRLLFGTSPHRYMTMRRLNVVKASLAAGNSLTEAALTAGFFDQSHMTRHFTNAYGLSPARWQKIQNRTIL